MPWNGVYFTDRNQSKSSYHAQGLTGRQNTHLETRCGEDGKLAPKLYFKTDGQSTSIYDSRSGEAVEYRINDVERALLDCLMKPKRIHELTVELGHIPHFDAEKQIASLQERGLIFEENERFMSLVLPKEPPEMTFKTT